MTKIPKSSIRYGVYIQESIATNKEGGVFFNEIETMKLRSMGIETATWLSDFRLLEFVAGISMQTFSIDNELTIDNRSVNYTQGASGRVGLIIAPSLGPVTLSVEASAEVARFVNGSDTSDDRAYLPAVSYKSATILGGARMRF